MLHEYSIQQLSELTQLLEIIDETEYTQTMEEVFYSTIGKHTRHIIEFYDAFYKGYKSGFLCYDERKRKLKWENEKAEALRKIEKLQKKLSHIPDEKNLILKLEIQGNSYHMPTTVAREFLYLMEHTTHHLALIRIGLQNINPGKNEFETLGVAYSTPKA